MSWFVETVDAISDDFDHWHSRRSVERAIRETIKHCARIAEATEEDAPNAILALLEPGDEGGGRG